MQPTKPIRILAFVSAVLIVSGAAHSQTVRTWIGTSGDPTNYTNAFNWTGGQIPLGSDIARFVDTTANNLTSSGNIGAGRLILTNSTVSFVSANNMQYVSGFAISLNDGSSLFLRTNSAADATTFHTNIAYLGDMALFPRSTLTLDEGFGGTVSLTATSAVVVGGGSPGTLAVQNGATLTTSILQLADIAGLNEASVLSVSGTNAQVNVTDQAIIGHFGSAQLNIQSRGIVSAGELVIGRNTTSSGTVNISNTGSQLNVANGLFVGSNGTGALNVFTGAVVNSDFGAIGTRVGNGTVNIDGAGSRWNVANSLTLGSTGGTQGVLNLTGGAQVSASILNLRTNGRIDVTDSTVTVGAILTGLTGTLNFNSGTFNVTNQDLALGQTDLLPQIANISSGQNINISGIVTIVNGTELTLSGGGFTAGNLVIESGGQFAATDNRSLTSSLLTNNGTVTGPAGASRLTFTGNVQGQGSFLGNTRFDGEYAPGNGAIPAIVTLDDAVFGDANILNLNVGFFGTQADRLTFAGLGTFGGTLELSFAGTYTPQAGHSFDLFDGPTSGTFSTFDFPDVSGLGLIYDLSQLYTSGVVSFAATLPGDYNQNGTVDAADYTVWRDNLGSATALPNDDTSGVDQDDYERWKTFFGATAGSGSSGAAEDVTAVPEPSTGAFVAALAWLSSWPANRRRFGRARREVRPN